MALTSGADDDQTGLIGRCGLRECDARVAVGNGDGAFHAEVAEWLERLFGVGPHAVLDAFDMSRRSLAAGVDAPNDRDRYANGRTEPGRSAQRIIVELEEGGYLTREKVGRRNHYRLVTTATLRHPHERAVEVRLLLDLFRNAGADTSIAEP